MLDIIFRTWCSLTIIARRSRATARVGFAVTLTLTFSDVFVAYTLTKTFAFTGSVSACTCDATENVEFVWRQNANTFFGSKKPVVTSCDHGCTLKMCFMIFRVTEHLVIVVSTWIAREGNLVLH